jgi:hypothetical protein
MRRPIGAIVIGAALAGLTSISFGGAEPAAAQCAPGSLIVFEGAAELSAQGESATRIAWTFRIDRQPSGLTLPDDVIVSVATDAAAGSLGDPIQLGSRYRATVQLVVADGKPTYVVDGCGGSFQLLTGAARVATTTTIPIFATTRTTVSAEHAARSTWKFLLGGLGILAVVGGVFRQATGRRRN